MTELLSLFQLSFLQGPVAKRPEIIIIMLTVYVDFEHVQIPKCALDHQKQTLDAMSGLIAVATDIGETNIYTLTLEQSNMIKNALDKIVLVNENTKQFWEILDTDVKLREDPIATAIYAISKSIKPMVLPTPMYTETIASILSPGAKLYIGDISYILPSSESGWCLFRESSETDKKIHDFCSGCKNTTDQKNCIEITYLFTEQESTKEAINDYVQILKDGGFNIDYFEFMKIQKNSSVGPVDIALVDIRDNVANVTGYMVLGSFIANGKFYIIRGLYDGTEVSMDYLNDSMFSIINSIEVTK